MYTNMYKLYKYLDKKFQYANQPPTTGQTRIKRTAGLGTKSTGLRTAVATVSGQRAVAAVAARRLLATWKKHL